MSLENAHEAEWKVKENHRFNPPDKPGRGGLPREKLSQAPSPPTETRYDATPTVPKDKLSLVTDFAVNYNKTQMN